MADPGGDWGDSSSHSLKKYTLFLVGVWRPSIFSCNFSTLIDSC